MVSKESACQIGYTNNFHQEDPMDADHSNLVKFSSGSDDDYVVVHNRLKQLVDGAPAHIKGRFAVLDGT